VHDDVGDREHRYEENRAQQVRQRKVDLTQKPAANGADDHCGPRHLLPAREDSVEEPAESTRVERIDEPRFHGTRVKREAEAHEDGDDGEGDDACVDLGERDVQERRRGEHGYREQERDPPPERVRNHTRRHLEHDHPCRERRVRDEDLEEAQPGVEQEERVDAPDDRR
jgi:hypothetical protein